MNILVWKMKIKKLLIFCPHSRPSVLAFDDSFEFETPVVPFRHVPREPVQLDVLRDDLPVGLPIFLPMLPPIAPMFLVLAENLLEHILLLREKIPQHLRELLLVHHGAEPTLQATMKGR